MSRLTQESAPQGSPGDATALFYDAVAGDYDKLMDRRAANEMRLSFCERVASAAGRGGGILDFGCGTGVDAAWYAARGHGVLAYDVSPGMVEVLQDRCRDDIQAGRIAWAVGPFEVLESALQARGQVAAIAANFAVLNHVTQLEPLLQRLAAHLQPEGALLACVLNPLCLRDLRRPWWWASLLRTRGAGPIRQDGKVTSHRHFVGAIRKAAAPAFDLEEVEPARGGMLHSDFLFVVLRRRR